MRSILAAVIAAVVGIFLTVSAPTFAQPAPATASVTVPRLVHITGTFQPVDGQPVANVEVVTVSIYADADGGLPVWQERQSVAVGKMTGRFTLLLGASYPAGIPAEVFGAGQAQWMSLLFERLGEVEQPRVRIASVPYALKASDAETLGGLPASAYLRAPTDPADVAKGDTSLAVTSLEGPVAEAVVLPGTTNFLAKYVNGADVGNSAVYETPTAAVPTGAVGIGTTTPLDQLHLRFTNSNGGITGLAVQNLGNSATSYSGMLFYDHTGALTQFQGYNNVTHEYRINNIATSPSINFMTGSASRLKIDTTAVTVTAPLQVSGVVTMNGGGGNIAVAGSSGTGLSGSGTSTGVRGTGSTGISGNGSVGPGVHGSSSSNHGVYGQTESLSASGVVGINTGGADGFDTGIGVRGQGYNGVYGFGIRNGVFGEVPETAPCPNCWSGFFAAAIHGVANHEHAYGVHGTNRGAGGTGVRGAAEGANGVGVDGYAQNGGAAGAFHLTGGIGDIIRGFGPTGNFSISGSGNLTITGGAFKPGGGSWSTLSDARAKQSIQPISNALSQFLKLRGVTYEYSNPSAFGELPGSHIGMVAQEVEQVFPSWVDTGADGYERLTFRGFEAVAVEAVRELDAQVQLKSQEAMARIADLERHNAELQHAINVLSEAVRTLQQK